MDSAFTYALNTVLLRKQTQRDSATSIVLILHIVPSVIAAPFALANWQPATAQVWEVFALVALWASRATSC